MLLVRVDVGPHSRCLTGTDESDASEPAGLESSNKQYRVMEIISGLV